METPAKSILIVEDDARQREILADFLRRRGYGLRDAPDAETALRLLDDGRPDLVLMDVRMPGMGGIRGLELMRERDPSLAVILLTAYAQVPDAVEAMRAGAVDYLEKPIDLGELSAVIAETIGEPEGGAPADLPPLPAGFVVASEAMRKVVAEAALVAPSSATVLVTGESGTGKELVAELIHQRSRRSHGPFVRVNCAAIAPTLVETELFGHVRGAFTGAEADRAGRFEAADGGTLFLDEIGELPLEVQPKLLRVLEDSSFERVGESHSRKVDVRVVAATNRDLDREVEGARFREDLFWRLNVFRIHLPPLRERREEIPVLARRFLARAGKERARISPAALRVLEAYEWPGNVRELGNIAMRAGVLASGDVILPEHLPDALREHIPPRAAGAPSVSAGDDRDADGVRTVEEAEREAIREALERTGGNRTRAAKLLGISRRTLLYRLKKYGGEP
ncbi:MAG: sigma-54-dependent Fis family transcriptional regulator [Planctomycetes bacterium]|nr:sigma-54-dependent Fis family transcriptional regulator [Planctomycetota bacterium]